MAEWAINEHMLAKIAEKDNNLYEFGIREAKKKQILEIAKKMRQ